MANPMRQQVIAAPQCSMAEMTGRESPQAGPRPGRADCMGVGAIIGTGIFVLTGRGGGRQGRARRCRSRWSPPGMTCIFAALCYAEFAAMVPVAGSAYTYAYATLGELFAWIIGWDLVLEYAVGASTVAHGWSHYFQDLLKMLNGGKNLWPHDPLQRTLRLQGGGFRLDRARISISRRS